METDTTGSWTLPEEYVMLRDTVRRFMERDVRTAEEKVPHDATGLPSDVLAGLQAQAREMGVWCAQSPSEYGGAGLNLLGQCVVAEAAAKCRMGLYFPAAGALGQDPPKVIFRGTPRQIEKYGASAIAKGSKTFVAISEAGGGSDPGRSIATRAELVGGQGGMGRVVCAYWRGRTARRHYRLHHRSQAPRHEPGMGMTHELPLERWYRELRIRRVGEGPSEVQRMVIARDMLSGRSKG